MDSCVFHSDALVFFGATGDLAYKKIFPALQEMIKRGTLAVAVMGVAQSGWNLPQLQARAREGWRDPKARDLEWGSVQQSRITRSEADWALAPRRSIPSENR